MRVALISDIHGNFIALEAVLADIERVGVDRTVCLGDVATLGPQPREVMARLRALACSCVMGNHDEYLFCGAPALSEGWVGQVVEWSMAQLSEADLDFVRSFEPVVEVALDEAVRLLCFHGSPTSNTAQLFPTTPNEVVDEMFAGYEVQVAAGGHTHLQMMRQHKGMLLLNAGSVGQPFKEWPLTKPYILPWAEYAIVGWQDGALHVDLRRVFPDMRAVKEAALASEMPGAEYWVSSWLPRPDSKPSD